MTPTLATIGYERHPEPESLIAALRTAGVQLLVDVRDLPLSRRRGFSKRALAEALQGAGIRYEHARALGNPKPYRDLYKQGSVAEGRELYTRHLQAGSTDAVDALEAQVTSGERTCVLCVEHDHEVCHRAVLADLMHTRLSDLEVVHL